MTDEWWEFCLQAVNFCELTQFLQKMGEGSILVWARDALGGTFHPVNLKVTQQDEAGNILSTASTQTGSATGSDEGVQSRGEPRARISAEKLVQLQNEALGERDEL